MVIEPNKTAAEVLPYYEDAMSVARRTQDQKDIKFKNKIWHLAYLYTTAGRWPEAEALWAENIKQLQLEYGAEHAMTAQFLKGQAHFFMRCGRLGKALTNLERIIPIYHHTVGTNHSNVLDAEGLLAGVYEHEGRVEDVAKIYESLYLRWAKLFPYYPTAWNKCWNIAQFLVKHRRYEEAKAVYELLRDYWETNPPENSKEFEDSILATAAARGWPAAAALCQKQFDSFPDSLWIWLNKAWIFRYVGDEEHYQELVKRVLSLPFTVVSTNDQQVPIEIAALEDALPGRGTNHQIYGYRAIGHLQLQLGRLDKCLEAMEKSAARQVTPDPYNLFIKASCLHRLGRTEDARAAFAQAEAIMRPQLEEPFRQVEGFIPVWQIYQQILMHREAQATLATR